MGLYTTSSTARTFGYSRGSAAQASSSGYMPAGVVFTMMSNCAAREAASSYVSARAVADALTAFALADLAAQQFGERWQEAPVWNTD